MAMCRCGAVCDRDELVGGECWGCRGVRTLPASEWAELSAAKRRNYRKIGVTPHYPARSEDEAEYDRQRSSQYDGPG